jgi:hypothetical protein
MAENQALPEYIEPVPREGDKKADDKAIEPDIVEVEQRYLAGQWSQRKDGKPVRGGLSEIGRRNRDWAQERRALARRTVRTAIREKAHDEFVFTGVGLSGGGIRSATFCLGILQAFAARGLLRHFDYLSTVSGGGYLGASLRWWWSRPGLNCGTGIGDFPYGTQDPDGGGGATDADQARRLDYLRTHGNYLAPGDGISLFSGIAAVLRTMLLNLIVWIPICAAVFAYLFALSIVLRPHAKLVPNPLAFLMQAGWPDPPPDPTNALPVLFAVLACMLIVVAIFFALAAIAYGFFSARSHDVGSGTTRPLLRIGLAAGLALASFLSFRMTGRVSAVSDVTFWEGFGLALALGALLIPINFAFARGRAEGTDEAYKLRREFESQFGSFMPYFAVLAAVAAVPAVAGMILNKPFGGSFGGAGLVAGLAAAWRGQYAAAKSLVPGFADNIFLPIGSALLLFGALVLSYIACLAFVHPATFISVGNDLIARAVLIAVALGAWCMAFFANINQIGLHRYYRDRLMEAFMPSPGAMGKTAASPEADGFKLHEAWPHGAALAGGVNQTYGELPYSDETAPIGLPYPIVNANAVLIHDSERKVAARGGDNYILSPMYCGSSSTGWVRTQHPICRKLTLASAMAASGAAANSNSGYIGGGLTRNTLISIAMMFLNIRLGYWVPNPSRGDPVHPQKWRNPDHFHPGFTYGALGRGYRRDSDFLELSDGGHFENLGLYELARRRCRVIVVCDGEADKQTAYLAFVSAVRRIEEDFKATIEFIDGKGPERLVASVDMAYPWGAKQAKAPFLVARINYRDAKTHGVIIYIKSALIAEASFKVKGYRGANADFPNESTIDQFFDPVQFEAYRELGYRAGALTVDKLRLTAANICNWEAIWRRAGQPGV